MAHVDDLIAVTAAADEASERFHAEVVLQLPAGTPLTVEYLDRDQQDLLVDLILAEIALAVHRELEYAGSTNG